MDWKKNPLYEMFNGKNIVTSRWDHAVTVAAQCKFVCTYPEFIIILYMYD